MKDTLTFDFSSKKWTLLNPSNPFTTPPGRRRHSGTFVGKHLVIFGGYDGNFLNDMYYAKFDSFHI